MGKESYESKMNYLASNIAKWREKKGFITNWENMPVKLMLCVTELAEAMEAYRNIDRARFNEEIADTFIRLLDITGTLKIDIEEEITKKMLINEKRPYRHNKKAGDV